MICLANKLFVLVSLPLMIDGSSLLLSSTTDYCVVLLEERFGYMHPGTYSPRISFCNSDSFCENLFWNSTGIVYSENEPEDDSNRVTCDAAMQVCVYGGVTTAQPSMESVDDFSSTTTSTTTTISPSSFPIERLSSDLELYRSIPIYGSLIRLYFSQLMEELRASLIPGILRFPMLESVDERDAFEQGLLRADQLLHQLSERVNLLPRSIRKDFAGEIATSRTLNKWRRSIGFLTANVVNSYPQIIHLDGSRDLAGLSIAQFLSFAKMFPLVNAAFISAGKQRELQSVLEMLLEDHPVADCEDSSSDTGGGASHSEDIITTTSAPTRRSSFRITPKSLADYPHKSRKCLVCAAIRASGDLQVRFPVFFTHLAKSIKSVSESAAAAPTGVGFGGFHVCKNLIYHINDAVCIMSDLFAQEQRRSAALSGDVVSAREFCKNSGDATLRIIHYCNTRFRKEIPRFETIPMAMRFGRLCGTLLPYDTRANVLPSLMVNSLTPLDEERYEDDDSSGSEEDEDEVGGGGSESSSHEIHVPQGPNMAFVSIMRMVDMDRFSFESVEDFAVYFDGSQSVGDGTRKEWISSMFEHMIMPSFHLFEYSDEREVYMKPRPLRSPEHAPNGMPGNVVYEGGMLKLALRTYRQFGRLIGMALEDGICPGISLTDGALAFIQRYPSAVDSSVESVSRLLKTESFYLFDSLQKLKRTNWSDPEQLAVVGDMDFEGLKPYGESIHLNETNVEEFVWLSMKKTVFDSIDLQMTHVVAGIYEVLPLGRLSFLSKDELRLLLQGQPEIDRTNLRASTEYQPANATSEPEIAWFWDIVESMSETQMRDLLKFVSGSSNPPIHNFSGYRGGRKWLQVSLQYGLTVDQVPLAQTCFVQIRLPKYTSLEVMRARLLFAIENARSMENV